MKQQNLKSGDKYLARSVAGMHRGFKESFITYGE
jgi:hypothetical protein